MNCVSCHKYSITYVVVLKEQVVSAPISFRTKHALKWFRLTHNSRIEGYTRESNIRRLIFYYLSYSRSRICMECIFTGDLYCTQTNVSLKSNCKFLREMKVLLNKISLLFFCTQYYPMIK